MDFDPKLLLMHPDDNCLVLRQPVAAGEPLSIAGVVIQSRAAIETGHKVARQPIAAGEAVRRYGARIGTATQAIAAGEHIHTHNLRSDYLPTYTLENGKAFIAADRAQPEGER